MVKRRNRLEIIADILSCAVGGGVKATHIVYRANLNHSRFRRYVEYLERRGLVESLDGPDGSRVYRTTEKGRLLLELLLER